MHVVNRVDASDGRPNPRAPLELRQFEFLIGRWHCEARLKQEDGAWRMLKATWEGRYVLDGYAIADEFRLMTVQDELLVLGVNLRAYDAAKRQWNMKWLSGLSGTWVDLGPEPLGGVRATDGAITYCMHEPVARHALTRATYCDIAADRFTWRGERSDDGSVWEEFMVIAAHRLTD